MTVRRRLVRFSIVTGATVGLDQLSKALARAWIAPGPLISLLGGIVRLTYTENVGAFMGLGSNLPPVLRTLFFSFFSALVVVGAALYVITAPRLTPLETAAASLLVSGGVGNLIDRVLHRGGVTDFLNVGIGPLRTGVFNVADVAIVVGVIFLTLAFYRAAGDAPGE